MSASLLAALTRRAADVQLQLDTEPRQLLSLSNDELACVLHHLPLAHDIAVVASTCRGLRDAARLAMAVRPYSGRIATLTTFSPGPDQVLRTVTAGPECQFITASHFGDVHLWCSVAKPRLFSPTNQLRNASSSVAPPCGEL